MIVQQVIVSENILSENFEDFEIGINLLNDSWFNGDLGNDSFLIVLDRNNKVASVGNYVMKLCRNMTINITKLYEVGFYLKA